MIPIDIEATPVSAPRSTPKRRSFSPALAIAVGWLAVLLIGVLGAPFLAPYDPIKQDLTSILQLPSSAHWLGTDGLGRDILSRMLVGGQVSLSGAVLAVVIALVLGAPAGLVAGYNRGSWFDGLGARSVDFLQSVPVIVILLTVLALTGRNVFTAMAIFGLIISPSFFRLARDGAAATASELYVDAAKVYGLRSARIIFRHVLPNVRNPLIVQATVVLCLALLTQAGLSFLGLASPPPAPSWGGSIADANTYINQQPWMLVPSGLVLVATILALTVVGDYVRDRMPGAVPPDARDVFSKAKNPTVEAMPAPVDERHLLLSVAGLTASSVRDGNATPILRGVSFGLSRGEILALVGESGSGKTMTAMAILGLLPSGVQLTAGGIWLDGQDLLAMSENQLRMLRGRRLAYIGQEPMVSLDPAFTVEAQIVESLKLHRRMSRREMRAEVRRLLGRVKISEPDRVAKSYPHELSGGMAQRVCIAMALAAQPELLIADEPTTALDVTVQAEVLDLLRELCRESGMAMIIVTHDFGVVADVADRAVVMLSGEIVEDAGVDDIFTRPAHPYTRSLLDASPARQGDEKAVWFEHASVVAGKESA